MADGVKKVERYSTDVVAKPGEGARVLGALAAGKVDMLSVWAYPLGNSGQARIEIVPKDSAKLKAAAKQAKIKLKRESAAFYISGRDKIGVLGESLVGLAKAGITIHAAQAVSVGTKFGCVVEVDSKNVRKAAKALGV